MELKTSSCSWSCLGEFSASSSRLVFGLLLKLVSIDVATAGDRLSFPFTSLTFEVLRSSSIAVRRTRESCFDHLALRVE